MIDFASNYLTAQKRYARKEFKRLIRECNRLLLNAKLVEAAYNYAKPESESKIKLEEELAMEMRELKKSREQLQAYKQFLDNPYKRI